MPIGSAGERRNETKSIFVSRRHATRQLGGGLVEPALKAGPKSVDTTRPIRNFHFEVSNPRIESTPAQRTWPTRIL